MGVDEYHDVLRDAATAKVFSIDYSDPERGEAPEPAGDQPPPLHHIEEEGFQEALAAAIRSLPEREQLVMSLYYDDELNLREIGEVLGVTESRVSQIHGRIMLKLRGELAEWVQR